MTPRSHCSPKKWFGLSRVIRGTATLALLLGAMALAAPSALAGGCYPDAYYSFLFNPTPQQVVGGDTRLVGASDSLTATGEDPKDKPMGAGCMCGVNNGRWDQMLHNDAAKDMERAPVAFRIDAIRGDMFDKMSKPRGKPIIINSKRLATCLGTSVKSDGYYGFDHPTGLTKAASVLEPGENIVGCLCLAKKLRTLSGTLKLKVDYTTLILVRQLPVEASSKAGTFAGQATVEKLNKGQAHYFQITLPNSGNPSNLNISLSGEAKAKLYTLDQAMGFKDAIKSWQYGGLQIKAPKPGAAYWIMVRAQADKAAATVKVSYDSAAAPPQEAKSQGPAMLKVGKAASRTFNVYLLGMGTPDRKAPSSFEAGTSKALPCCSGG